MSGGPPLSITTWLIAASPVAILLATILFLRWDAVRSAGLAWLVALVAGALVFGGSPQLLALASAKGLSLSLFVLLIVWSAIFLYNMADQLGAIQVIGRKLTSMVEDRLLCALMIAWAFSGFIQGIAGFGVPVAVVTPLMLFAGFSPIPAVVSVMIGHSWAITFGSMASSYFAILLVTGLAPGAVATWTAVLFALPIFLVGLSVAHVHGGAAGLKRSLLPVFLSSAVMSGSMIGLAYVGAAQVASIVPGLLGVIVMIALARFRRYRPVKDLEFPAPIRGGGSESDARADLGFNMAFLPYYLLIALSLISQIPAVKDATAGLAWGLDYPAVHTAWGFQVEAQKAYSKIRLFNHPAPLIGIATFLTYAVYILRGKWRKDTMTKAAKLTFTRSVPMSLAISLLVMMALTMSDTGMALTLAKGIQVTGGAFPALSPFIGVLGALITGSNTNSNIMFGALQQNTALALGVTVMAIIAAQSVGGSLGAGVSPDKALIGSAIVGMTGSESKIMRRAIPYTLLIVLAVGIEVLAITLFSNVLAGW
ncbi:MAG: L-lactate permease [Chloroflexi bacterium]|nr:L-lactate permease [Chloroflexota bacterium]